MSENGKRKKLFGLEHWQEIMLILMVYDAVVVNLSYFLALWLRFDSKFSLIPAHYLDPWKRFAPYYTVFCLVVFMC